MNGLNSMAVDSGSDIFIVSDVHNDSQNIPGVLGPPSFAKIFAIKF